MLGTRDGRAAAVLEPRKPQVVCAALASSNALPGAGLASLALHMQPSLPCQGTAANPRAWSGAFHSADPIERIATAWPAAASR